jgi:Fur family peroxide stress response transcriptional regulator
MKDQQLITKLREKGFKVTPQRLAICEFVLSTKEHPTVDQVYRMVKKKHPTISLATVYQTLHLLTEIGMLQELGFGSGIARYDPNYSPHINIVCRNCGKVEDYESESVREFLSHISVELKRTLIGQHLEVCTHCDQCEKSGT